jgi:hypothetical protein
MEATGTEKRNEEKWKTRKKEYEKLVEKSRIK